jgi:isopentenyl-diphosphate delta-isomerase
LPVPVVAKETGCGLSRAVGERLAAAGVRVVDVSGAGGTSWVGVESHRAGEDGSSVGERFWDWGVPTAASVAQLSGLPLDVVATGGIADGLAAARALALGATAVGIARPLLQAWSAGGRAAVDAFLAGTVRELRLACWLCGAGGPADLARLPVVLGPRLRAWVPRGSPLAARSGA